MKIAGPDYERIAMQHAIGEYRAFLRSLTDPKLVTLRNKTGVRNYAKKLLARHAASEDAYVSAPPKIPDRVEPEVRGALQCVTCLKLTTYIDFTTRIFNPGRCACGGTLQPYGPRV